MADTNDKWDINDSITDPDTKKTQQFTKKPGVMDYFKEAFQPDNVRAQLEAVRQARAKAGGGS